MLPLPPPSTSSTLLSLLRRSTLSSPLLSSPLRLLSARFLHAPRFFSYFPRVSLLSLLSRGVGRPRPLPAFFPLRLDPPLLRPATSYSAFFRFSPISAILVFSADRSARSFASRKFRSETNDDFKIEANRATSSFRIGQENAFLSSPVSVRRGRCVHHPSRKSDSSANRSRFRNHEFRDDIRSPDGLQRRTSNIVRVSFVQDGFAFEKLPARVSNFKLFALRSSSPFVRVRLSLSLSLSFYPSLLFLLFLFLAVRHVVLATPFPRSGCCPNTIRFRNARAILRCPLHPRHCSRSRCVTHHESGSWFFVSILLFVVRHAIVPRSSVANSTLLLSPGKNQSIPKVTIFARKQCQFDRTCMSLEPIYSRLYRANLLQPCSITSRIRLAHDVPSQMLLVKRKRERERNKVCKQSAKLLQAPRKALKVFKVSEFDDIEYEITACNCIVV